MKSIILLTVAIATITAGLPIPEPQNNLVPGVFISADAFKRLQDQANVNRQNQPELRSSVPVQNGQILAVNQPSTQPLLMNQPSSNQPIYLVQQQPPQSVVVQSQKQPTSVIVSNSNPASQPSYSSGNYYAVVPLNNQNQGSNSGNTYLVPVPSNNPIILNN